MLQLALLNSLVPKLAFFSLEHFTGHIKNWYTDGYRTSAPGTTQCDSTSDCEKKEVCIANTCKNLSHSKYE